MKPCACPACDLLAAAGRPFKVAAFVRNTGEGVRVSYREPIRVPPGHSVSVSGPGFDLDGDRWTGGEEPVTITVTLAPAPQRPISRYASDVDSWRLRTGYAAVRLLGVEPWSRAEAHAVLAKLTDGACALESITDWATLGQLERHLVREDLNAIRTRSRALAQRLADGEFPDVRVACTKGEGATARPDSLVPEPGETLPRCDKLDGTSLSIVAGNIEAGRFCEAQAVTITDGTRSAVYVPLSDQNRTDAGGMNPKDKPPRVLSLTVDVAADGRSYTFREPVVVPDGCSVSVQGPFRRGDQWVPAGGSATVEVTITRASPAG